MLRLSFNSPLAESYAKGCVISSGVGVAEVPAVRPVEGLLVAGWLLCRVCCRSSVSVGLLKAIRNGPASTLALAFNALWQELADLAGGGSKSKARLLCPRQSYPWPFSEDGTTNPTWVFLISQIVLPCSRLHGPVAVRS